MKAQEFLKYFQDEQNNILDSIREIVEIESPSRDLSGSLSVVDFIADKTAKISPNFKIERIFAENYGEHLIVRAFESNEKPILILGHTDTVHPRKTKKQNPTRIEDDKFYGCGIFDMKANIILALECLRAFTKFNLEPKRPLTVLLSCDEEIGSPTGRALVEHEAERAEFCLVCEPSANGKVKTGRKGTGMFRLKTHGVPAHAGLEPEKGASAILEIARQISKIQDLNDSANGTTANVCTISGGTTSNVIPEHASCEIDIRFTKKSEAERVKQLLRDLKPFDKKVSLEIVGEINRPPLERTEAVVNLYEKARKIAESFDYELGETQVGGASDGNFVAALGVPVLDGLGIAGNGAHTLEEFIFINDISRRAALLALLLLNE